MPKRRAWKMNSPSSLVLARLGTMGLALATAPIIARAIGPRGRGEVAAAMMTATLIPLAVGLGVPLAVRVFTASTGGTQHLRAGRRFAWVCLPACLALAVAARWTVLTTLSASATIAFVSYASMGALFVHAMCDQSFLMVHRRYLHIAILQASQIVMATISIGALWALDSLNVASILWAQSTGQLAAFGCGLLFVGRLTATDADITLRTMLRKSLRFSGIQLAEAAAQRLDQVVMVPIIGLAQSGFYALASTLSAIPIALGHAMGTIYFQAFARATTAEMRHLARRAIRITFVLSASFAAIIAAVSIPIVPWLFGEPFRPAVEPTLIALAGSPFFVSGYVGAQALTARGDARRVTVSYAVGTVVGLAALLVLGPHLGAIGAAISALAGYATTLVFVSIPHGLRLGPWLPRISDFHGLLSVARNR